MSQSDAKLESFVKQLKEAEQVLSAALYQAKQKLQLIKKANDRPVASEELLKYAYSISAQHSVASPYNWEIGDPRRPYPTDFQMRQSLLSGNTKCENESTQFRFIPTALPSNSTKKVNIEEKDVDLMSTDSSTSSSSDSP